MGIDEQPLGEISPSFGDQQPGSELPSELVNIQIGTKSSLPARLD